MAAPGNGPSESQKSPEVAEVDGIKAQALAATGGAKIGTNLDGLADWSEDWAFVDGFKRSRTWISGTAETFDDGRDIAVDKHGWVTSLRKGQVARTLMFWDAHYPSGTYVILYDGKGSFTSQPFHSVVESQPGRRVLQVDSTKGGIEIILTEINPSDPIRNIRVIMPGGACANDAAQYCDAGSPCSEGVTCNGFEEHYKTQVFHPKFLKRIAPYTSLRFMDWMYTNGSAQERWEGRPRPEDARYQQGAPIEVMVALANQQKQDPWFTLPHRADDNYVRKFAEYVRDNLAQERKVYLEHSNEVWNGQFTQAQFAVERGRALKLGPSDFEAQLQYHARRTREIAKIWTDVMGPQRNRLVRVLGSQAANPWTAEMMLDFEDTKSHVDAIAIAPYFGGHFGTEEQASRVSKLSLDAFFSELRSVALPETSTWITQNAKVARARNVLLLAYEGGQHLTGVGPAATENAALNSLFDRANRDPRMGELYSSYLNTWRDQGGGLFMHFVDCAGPSKWGRWGALEWLEQPREQAPKFDALMRYIEAGKY